MKKLVAFMSSLALMSACVPTFPANADYYTTTTYPYTSSTSYSTTSSTTTTYKTNNSTRTNVVSDNTTPPSIDRSLPSNAILYDNFYYIKHDNYIEIWGVTDQTVTEITIPSQISGLPVTTIANSAFYGCTALTSITIPDSVTSIGTPDTEDAFLISDSVFAYCTSLRSIYIPDSVTSIGDGAFCNCLNLTSIHLPANIKELPSGWNGGDPKWYCGFFGGCKSLKTVTIPETVTSIEDSAFSGCSALTSIVIPENVSSIGARAFLGCDNLTSVTIKNPKCTFDYFNHSMASTMMYVFYATGDGAIPAPENLTLYGYEGSTTQAYATEHNIAFAVISEELGDTTWNGKNPDLNGDGRIDAKDAALVLVFAAEFGAGNVRSFQEFMDKQYPNG